MTKIIKYKKDNKEVEFTPPVNNPYQSDSICSDSWIHYQVLKHNDNNYDEDFHPVHAVERGADPREAGNIVARGYYLGELKDKKIEIVS